MEFLAGQALQVSLVTPVHQALVVTQVRPELLAGQEHQASVAGQALLVTQVSVDGLERQA